MEDHKDLKKVCAVGFVLWVELVLVFAPGAEGWSKEGHAMTCRIAQVMPCAPMTRRNVTGEVVLST